MPSVDPRDRATAPTHTPSLEEIFRDSAPLRSAEDLAARRGRPRPQNDTGIAACCLVYDLPLPTLNVKDFVDVADHEGLVLVSA
jgi:predicted nucleic acid-binding protein